MYDILKLNKISEKINAVFDGKYNLCDECDNPTGILVRSANMAEYAVKDNLVAVARAGAGVNNIPCKDMAAKGVVVFNTPGANANAVKELVVLAMLLASRDIIGGNKWVNSLTENVAKTTEKGKSAFAGREISGKTLGIVGLGAIGKLVAESALALGMNVIGYDPFLNDKVKAELGDKVEFCNFEDTVKKSDIITLHVPLTDDTKNMINADTIAKMKDGAIVINMARGALVDVAALKEGIARGKIAKYVVDFPDESTINSENIIAIPHLGASTEEAEDNCAVMAGKELVDYIENGNIVNSVNYPSLTKERVGKVRTCVLFRAEDKAAIDDLGGDKKVAVKGDYGYAIIDGEQAVAVEKAIKVRVI